MLARLKGSRAWLEGLLLAAAPGPAAEADSDWDYQRSLC